MTYQATIHFRETKISTQLILQLDANSPESAHQIVKQRWKNIRQQLPKVSTPRLLKLNEVKTRCPKCGATELSFCKH